MLKHVGFHNWRGNFWPSLNQLKPYFIAPRGREWFYTARVDDAIISLEGVEGTEHLGFSKGRKDICLWMWGNPDHGVLLMYEKIGAKDHFETKFSKGDMSRIGEWVRTLQDDLRPIGLYIPFAK